MKDILVLLVTMGGGLGCFLLAMKHLSEGLQSIGGVGLKRFMSAMKPYEALATGFVKREISSVEHLLTLFWLS